MKTKIYLLLTWLFISTRLFAQTFYQDLWQGNTENVEEYIKNNPDIVHDVNQWGLSPIQVVISWGHRNHKEIIDKLLINGADINQLSNNGRTVIHFAAESASIDLLKYLIDKGADISILDDDNNSALYYAVLRKDNQIIDLVNNETIQLPATGEKGRKLLLSAVSCGNEKIVNALIQNGADIYVKRADGATLLHCAAEGNMINLLDQLIREGFDINAQNKYYYTPLHLAVKNKNIGAIKKLIKKGANIESETNTGLKPYHIAIENENKDIVEILVNSGAKTDQFEFNIVGEYFGQKLPGSIPEIFAPGIVSTMDGFEFAGVFTPDNKEFFFTQRGLGFGQRIRYLKVKDGKWQRPDFAPFTYDCFEFEPGISPDGEAIFYGSMRPLPGSDEINRSIFIWKVTKNEGWKNPQLIGGEMMYVNVAANGNIYTTSLKRDGDKGIIKRELHKNEYSDFINLGDSINFMLGTAHPYIAPDESYVIFDAQPEEYGENGALFISFKKNNGTWTKAKAFGDEINFGQVMTAWVSHDQKYMFFHSTVDGFGDIYWVDASVIQKMKKEILK